MARVFVDRRSVHFVNPRKPFNSPSKIAFSTLRVYATSDRDIAVTMTVLLLPLDPLGIDAVSKQSFGIMAVIAFTRDPVPSRAHRLCQACNKDGTLSSTPEAPP